jgi:hypothetical protein
MLSTKQYCLGSTNLASRYLVLFALASDSVLSEYLDVRGMKNVNIPGTHGHPVP